MKVILGYGNIRFSCVLIKFIFFGLRLGFGRFKRIAMNGNPNCSYRVGGNCK